MDKGSNREPVFEAGIPVFVGWDDAKAIGVAKGFRDLDTGHIHMEIEFNSAASGDLEEIFRTISTQALNFSGTSREAAVDASMAHHPAGKKRGQPIPNDPCHEWLYDELLPRLCTKPYGHSGPHG